MILYLLTVRSSDLDETVPSLVKEEGVSTIPDECKEVEAEISTVSKRTTAER